MRFPLVRRARYESVLEDGIACALALRAIDDRLNDPNNITRDDLLEVAAILNLTFRHNEQP